MKPQDKDTRIDEVHVAAVQKFADSFKNRISFTRAVNEIVKQHFAKKRKSK